MCNTTLVWKTGGISLPPARGISIAQHNHVVYNNKAVNKIDHTNNGIRYMLIPCALMKSKADALQKCNTKRKTEWTGFFYLTTKVAATQERSTAPTLVQSRVSRCNLHMLHGWTSQWQPLWLPLHRRRTVPSKHQRATESAAHEPPLP
jgi:hypothetical protein